MASHLLRPGLALVLATLFAVLAASEIRSGSPLTSYNTVIVVGALAAMAAVLWREVRLASRRSPDKGEPTALRDIVRLCAFGALWLAYVFLLPPLGFAVATALALVGSLWLLSGRIGVDQFATAIGFVLVLSVLVGAVLFVPVPKGPLDIAIEEAVFSLR